MTREMPFNGARTLPAMAILMLAGVLSPGGARAQLSFERPPISYSQTQSREAVADLFRSLDRGDRRLEFEPGFGYLPALLDALDIPASSQTLVFGKNSLQKHMISPDNPRAIYFNDEIYVGYIPNAKQLEIASMDSQLGAVFYTIDQVADAETSTRIRANHSCLFCHASTDTGRVPGLIMQSNWTSPKGYRVFPKTDFHPDPAGTFQQRWGGWFVTGNHGKQTHLGNVMVDTDEKSPEALAKETGNLATLARWFSTDKYLEPGSDLVALLVLQHQVSIHNLLTRSSQQVRALLHEVTLNPNESDAAETDQKIRMIAEELADGLLGADTLGLSEPVSGSSSFERDFANRPPLTADGRSLRQFDLSTRLFRYPCSYLIYTDAFIELPARLRQATVDRIASLLSQGDSRPRYAHLDAETRTSITEILGETHPLFRPQTATTSDEASEPIGPPP